MGGWILKYESRKTNCAKKATGFLQQIFFPITLKYMMGFIMFIMPLLIALLFQHKMMCYYFKLKNDKILHLKSALE